MKNKIIALTIGVLVLGFCGLFLLTLQRHTVIPRSIKLTDCTNSVLEFDVRIPKGNSYYLVLATPGVGMTLNSPYIFSGNVHILDKANQPIDFPIGSELAQQCNWLERDGIPYSLAITGLKNTNCPLLDNLIHGAKDYHVKIIFNRPPPTSTSIWLHWLQAYKDKDE